jgi:hypothetical protein
MPRGRVLFRLTGGRWLFHREEDGAPLSGSAVRVIRYERPRHVDAAVVADIAGWLRPGRGRPRSPYAEAGSGELWLVEV